MISFVYKQLKFLVEYVDSFQLQLYLSIFINFSLFGLLSHHLIDEIAHWLSNWLSLTNYLALYGPEVLNLIIIAINHPISSSQATFRISSFSNF